MRWWVEVCADGLLGANQDFLVLRRTEALFLLQDRVTGQRVPLFENKKGRGFDSVATNGKWFVGCQRQGKMLVVKIPQKNPSGSKTAIRKPTVVSFDKRWRACIPRCGINEDHLLLRCHGFSNFFKFVLVDLLQTYTSNKLVVLSSSVPRLEATHPIVLGRGLLICNPVYSFRKENGSHSFVLGHYIPSAFSRGVPDFMTFEEGTGGKPQPTFPSAKPFHLFHEGWLQQLDKSQFCAFSADVDAYEVWNLNDTTRPVRKQKFLSGCAKDAFIEGGLLFQVSESLKEIHVTEESSGWLQQLDKSQFCAFSADVDAYEVWNLNDTTRPVRKQKFLSGCAKDAFVEGGLLFQVSESLKEIHVTEESSGTHIITFNLFRPFMGLWHHFSFPLSE
ncbi:hypothetical protein Pelo_987 [Pelomyxa schiedti]|nr:hypothetical protein Pelo_987 [Pelomyxa schiedti]